MYDEYLFDFSYVLHITPREVDALRYRDFCNLIMGLDKLRAELERRRRENE